MDVTTDNRTTDRKTLDQRIDGGEFSIPQVLPGNAYFSEFIDAYIAFRLACKEYLIHKMNGWKDGLSDEVFTIAVTSVGWHNKRKIVDCYYNLVWLVNNARSSMKEKE